MARSQRDEPTEPAIADGKTDYVKTDIDDAGAIDGTEIAVVLNLLTVQINHIIDALEEAGIIVKS